jgi:6-phosphogluconolactonase
MAAAAAGKTGVVTRSPELSVLADPDALAESVADWILRHIGETESVVAIALSGGTTPARLFSELGGSGIAGRIPWDRVHWFWGDERFVPRDHPRSNFRLAWTAFLSRVPVPEPNIHPVVMGQMGAEVAARAYEIELQRFYGSNRLATDRPLFHINLLGLGDDGHFASLFPGSTALGEGNRWAVATENDGEARISLTYPVLESSRYAAFLVAGETKSTILQRMIAADPSLPAARFSPTGELHIFADRAAAAKLTAT